MNREEYWNEQYLEYWRERTTDSNRRLVTTDCVPANVLLFEHYLKLLDIKPGDKILEVGVGFGRLIPSLVKRGASVFGVDISTAMIEEARKNYGSQVAELKAISAEELPYPDATFDNVVCWAVFDACYQRRALSEMSRVLKLGGGLLITGKNDDYEDDDELAYVAEVNARAKGHPNYFTNMPAFMKAMSAHGLGVSQTFFFRRRGDFSVNDFTQMVSPRFYEYLFVCRKEKHVVSEAAGELASSYSLTFARRDPAGTERVREN